MFRTYRCHVPSESSAADNGRTGRSRARLDPCETVGVAICPCCRAPLVAVMGRQGPYFYCQCHEKADSRIS